MMIEMKAAMAEPERDFSPTPTTKLGHFKRCLIYEE
jgi:hypothetical protein